MKQLLLLLTAISLATITYSQPGTIDETFGDNGFVSTKMPSDIRAIIQQKDGKLLTAGGFATSPRGNIARFF